MTAVNEKKFSPKPNNVVDSGMKLHRRFLLSIVAALIPLLILSSFIAITQQSTIFAKQPLFSDEIVHWAQTAAFRDAGFNTGYFTVNEKMAPLSQFHFYSWGPAAPVFYGLIAYFTGWEFYTPLLINLVLFGIAIAAFVNIARLSGQQIAWLTLLVATYPPLLMYAPTIMLEVLSYAVAVGLAVLFAQLIAQNQVTGRRVAIMAAIICLVATIRVTWTVLLIPLFTIHFIEVPTRRRALLDLIATLFLISSMFLLYFSWSSPYPNVRNNVLTNMSVDLAKALRGIAGNAEINIRRAFEGNAAQLVLRLQLFIIVISFLILVAQSFRRRLSDKQGLRLAIVCVFSLLGIFIFEVVGHQMYDWRDYRVFAPLVLFALLLIIVSNRQRLLGILIAVSLISYTAVWQIPPHFPSQSNKENSYASRLEDNEILFRELGIHFEPEVESAWCNTVLYTRNYFADPATLLAFEDGIGLSLLLNKTYLHGAPSSRYLLFDDETIKLLGDQARIKLLIDLPQGGLYENLDASCNLGVG